jgi:Asp-tRNA(Asn)/Glu-tRNA(Gln) amidotransferase A subunit family amidase
MAMPEPLAPPIRQVRTAGEPLRRRWLAAQQERFGREAPARHCLVRGLAPGDPDHPGLLQGVALAHKDVFDHPDHRPGAGAPPEQGGRRALAAPLARLQAAGALHLGSLTLAELCCGATGQNRHFGRPANPVDPEAVVGGSSSGSAVAVAAGLCAASLGTDTAGSVRIPAATCGVVGLKPTHGRIDARGAFMLAPSLDTVGVLARSASDAAHVWAALAAAEGAPPAAADSDAIEAALDAERPWQLALDATPLPTEVAAVLAHARHLLAQAWSVVERDVPERPRLNALAQIVLHVEAAAHHLHRLRHGAEHLPAAARAILLPGLALPPAWYARALALRNAEREAFLHGPLLGADLLLTPALGGPVPAWDDVTPGTGSYDARRLLDLHAHTPYVNYLGLPAIVFPAGTDRLGRPVSLQAIGRPGCEATLLAFAHQAMRALGTSAPTDLPSHP